MSFSSVGGADKPLSTEVDVMNYEFQNAYEVSLLTTPSRDENVEAERLSSLGFWVLTYGAEVCCRHTDAFIRWETRIRRAARTLAELEDDFDGEELGEFEAVVPPEAEAISD